MTKTKILETKGNRGDRHSVEIEGWFDEEKNGIDEWDLELGSLGSGEG